MSDTAPARTNGRRSQSVLACEECRSRKLRCDTNQPQCGTCRDLGVTCVIDTARRPRGPKKGHVNALKSRIAFLERQLNRHSQLQEMDTQPDGQENATQQTWEAAQYMTGNPREENSDDENPVTSQASLDLGALDPVALPQWPPTIPSFNSDSEWGKTMDTLPIVPDTAGPPIPGPENNIPGPAVSFSHLNVSTDPLQQGLKMLNPALLADASTVQMSNLERADLDDLFFERVYPFAPIIHQSRYYALATQASEPSESFTCLQYAMRTLAASMGSQFNHLRSILYQHTCCMLDTWDRHILDETVSIELVQAWLLLAIYEILKTDPQRGWISAGRCFRLIHLCKLHEIDNPENWQTSAWANLSWVEIEERRRTFWTAYTLDRYASLVSRLPVTLNEQMILTRLPAPETAFRRQQSVETVFLALAMAKKGQQLLSPYAKSIVIVTLLARSLSHQTQYHVERIIEPKSQNYLARHRALDDVLTQELQTTLSDISVDPESYDPTSVFTDMLAQATVLILFMTLNSVPRETSTDKAICVIYEQMAEKAAERIHDLTQKLSQLGCFKVHPFTPIALFICAEFTRPCNRVSNNSMVQYKAMSAALYDLSPANKIAGTFLRELELEHS